jgi:hypothetical protein
MFAVGVIRAVNYVKMGLPLAINAARQSFTMELMPVRLVDRQSELCVTIEDIFGGLPATIPVQLDGIRKLFAPDCALTKLMEMSSPSYDTLSNVNSQRLETDEIGLAEAWILRGFLTPVDPASPLPPTCLGASHRIPPAPDFNGAAEGP